MRAYNVFVNETQIAWICGDRRRHVLRATTLESVMSLVEPLLVVPPHVDYVLDEIGRTLQITPTQYERAKRAYESVGDWLENPSSPLAAYRPEIYPQGSMALRTTVRPLHNEEFDLDLVCELEGWTGTAMAIYKAIGDRLA